MHSPFYHFIRKSEKKILKVNDHPGDFGEFFSPGDKVVLFYVLNSPNHVLSKTYHYTTKKCYCLLPSKYLQFSIFQPVQKEPKNKHTHTPPHTHTNKTKQNHPNKNKPKTSANTGDTKTKKGQKIKQKQTNKNQKLTNKQQFQRIIDKNFKQTGYRRRGLVIFSCCF